jgi:hypothetical protein
MADGQNLSQQDVQDLQEIVTRLPAGHPMVPKISKLLNSQPTQFEQQNQVPGRLEAGSEEASKILSFSMLPNSISDIPTWASRMLGQEPGQKPWWEPFKEAWANPTERNIVGAVPVAGPIAVSAADEPTLLGKAGVLAGAGLGGATAETALRVPSKLGALASKAKEGTAPAIQKAIGVGPEFTGQAVKDYEAKAGTVTEANRSALSKARMNEETFQGKVEAAKQANEAAKQTAIEKQQLQTEAMGHAKELSEHLPQLKEQEKAFAKSLYPEVEGTADASEMQGRLQNAIDSNIRGTDKPPTTLTRIVKELEPENPLAQASVFRGAGSQGRALRGGVNLSDLPEAARAKILQRLGPEERAGYEAPETGTGKSLSFEQMHGYYSELGEELSKDLSGDERSSVTAARAELLGEMRKMAESEGKLTQFTEAQKNWSKYENTFNKTWNDKRGVASPIAKALNAKDPVTGEMLPDRLAQVLGKDQNYKLAQQMLSRYDAAKPELLQLMKEKMDQAGGMPKSIKETAIPERSFTPVNLKAPPTIDIHGLKAAEIQRKMAMLGGFSGRGMFIDAASLVHFLTTGNPIALSIPIGRRLLAKAIKAGAKSGSLVGVTAEEAEMLKGIDQSVQPKNIRPSQVYSTKAAALAARNP